MGLNAYLTLAAVVFSIGLFGVMTRRNTVGILLGIELMLNAVNINLVAFSRFHTANIDGQVANLFVIIIAAAEAAVALAIILRFYRLKQTIDADEANLLRN